ncbi:hypothetical protein C8Q78DRAFT_769710 [Trametes maxima]|nr:hypothetical protein C8Q78DRAFT_769710 [Trametes maxima]
MPYLYLHLFSCTDLYIYPQFSFLSVGSASDVAKFEYRAGVAFDFRSTTPTFLTLTRLLRAECYPCAFKCAPVVRNRPHRPNSDIRNRVIQAYAHPRLPRPVDFDARIPIPRRRIRTSKPRSSIRSPISVGPGDYMHRHYKCAPGRVVLRIHHRPSRGVQVCLRYYSPCDPRDFTPFHPPPRTRESEQRNTKLEPNCVWGAERTVAKEWTPGRVRAESGGGEARHEETR